MDSAKLMRLKNVRLRTCYEGIINAKTMEEIDKVVEDSGYDFSNIRSNFSFYEFIYSKEEIEKYYKKIEKYIVYRNKKIKKLQEEKRNLRKLEKLKLLSQEATLVISSYLEKMDESFEGFLAENNINLTKFKKYIEVLQAHNKPLYEEYMNKKEEKERKEAEIAQIQITNLLDAINNGINENDVVREFDTLDYFNITNIPVDRLVIVARTFLSNDELVPIKKFAAANEKCAKPNKVDEEAILNGYMLIDGKEITREENEAVFKYLEENNLPKNNITHRAALKRYLNGYLIIDEDTKSLKLMNE